MVFYCPKCSKEGIKKAGKIRVEKIERTRFKLVLRQAYRCMNNHLFIPNHTQSSFTNSFIEYAVIVYLRSLSLNAVIQILRVQFEKNILTKENHGNNFKTIRMTKSDKIIKFLKARTHILSISGIERAADVPYTTISRCIHDPKNKLPVKHITNIESVLAEYGYKQ